MIASSARMGVELQLAITKALREIHELQLRIIRGEVATLGNLDAIRDALLAGQDAARGARLQELAEADAQIRQLAEGVRSSAGDIVYPEPRNSYPGMEQS